MRTRVVVVASCLMLALTSAGCSVLDADYMRAETVEEPSREPTVTMMSVIPTNAPEPRIVSDGSKDVVTTIRATDELSTMGELLQASGLSRPLANAKHAYTLFVPTNYAFERLPAGWVEKLKDPANIEKLRTLLRYNLITGAVPSQQMYNIRTLMTYEGGMLQVTQKGATGYVNGVRLQQTDVRAKNGTLHITTAVIVPPGFKP